MATFITDDDLGDALAKAQGLSDRTDLADRWAGLYEQANTDAYWFIVRKLVGRGYSLSDVQQWPEATAFNRKIALFFTLCEGGVLADYDDKYIRSIDRRKELDDLVLIDANGNQILPTGAGVECASGRMDWSDEELTPDLQFTFSEPMKQRWARYDQVF